MFIFPLLEHHLTVMFHKTSWISIKKLCFMWHSHRHTWEKSCCERLYSHLLKDCPSGKPSGITEVDYNPVIIKLCAYCKHISCHLSLRYFWLFTETGRKLIKLAVMFERPRIMLVACVTLDMGLLREWGSYWRCHNFCFVSQVILLKNWPW